jgi:hypothetical protein
MPETRAAMKPVPLPTSKPVNIPASTPGKGKYYPPGNVKSKGKNKKSMGKKGKSNDPKYGYTTSYAPFKAAAPLMSKASTGNVTTVLLFSTLVQQATTTLGNFTKTGPNVNM